MADTPNTQAASEETVVPAEAPKKRPLGKIIGVVIVAIVATLAVRNFLHSRNHQTTDNAQIAGDVVLVAPLVQGNVSEILVQENVAVKKGQLLARLDDSKLKANFAQAKANLEAAIADAKTAGISVEVAKLTATASAQVASGTSSEARADVANATRSTEAARGAQKGMSSQEDIAQSNVRLAQLGNEMALKALESAKALIGSKESAKRLAQTGVDQAKAELLATKSSHDLAVQALQRARELYEAGAQSKAALEVANTNEETSGQAEAGARSRVESAASRVQQAAAELQIANVELEKNQIALRESQAKVSSARSSLIYARQSSAVSRLQAQATAAKIDTAQSHVLKSLSDKTNSQAQQANVSKLESSQAFAAAKLELAKAALKVAEIDLAHAQILAPCDGVLTRKSVEVGSFVQVGSAMMYVVPLGSLSVTANFKETQLATIHVGDRAEVEVDGVPGHTYHGVVDSLASATGATFALLPPDNSTGNFVKVVQRVPVKIKIDADDAYSQLRVGLSASVSITTK